MSPVNLQYSDLEFSKTNSSMLLEKKIIYFDVTTYDLRRNTGIERVVKELMNNLDIWLPENFVILPVIVDPEKKTLLRARRLGYNWLPGEEILLKKRSIFFGACLNIFLPKVLRKIHDSGCTSIVMLYDLVYVKYPETMYSKKFAKTLVKWLHCISSHSTAVIAISKTVQQEYLQWLKDNEFKNCPITAYVHLGCDFSNFDERKACLPQEINLNKLNLLAVSTIEPRKDYPLLLEAFKSALKMGLKANLFVVGRKGWGPNLDSLLTGTPFVYWFENSPDALLSKLYSSANFFVSSSIYEGFGLPLLEASNYKLPLILRDIPVYREIAGNNALFFSDAKDLTEIFLNLNNDKSCIKTNDLKVTRWLDTTKRTAGLILEIDKVANK